MKTVLNRSLMIWVIVILALMNITTMATILYNHGRVEKQTAVDESGVSITGTEAAAYSGRFFCDRLGFSNSQMLEFREVNQPFRDRVREINSDLNRIRQTMLDEMSKEESDTILLSSLADSVGQLHSELKKETYRYYLSMKEICNGQQEETLKQIFGSMFSGDLPKGRNGKGGEQGRHRGRQF
jgi:hypothetical protein